MKDQTKESKKTKRMKRVNGTGTVFKMEGRRRKPWRAMWQRKLVGDYETEYEAVEALDKARAAGPVALKTETVADIYNAWSPAYFKTIGPHGQENYETAWKHFTAAGIDKMKIKNIRTVHWQKMIDGAVTFTKEPKPLSFSGRQKLSYLAGQLSRYAVEQDVINKDYSVFVKLGEAPPANQAVYSDEEIEKLVKNDSETARIVLTLIYTGFRINELFGVRREDVNAKDGYIVGGEKTEAGVNRVIPIHPKIKNYINEWYLKGGKYLITAPRGGMMNDDHFRYDEYYPLLEKLGIERKTPHRTRHTFATKAAVADVRPEDITAMVGHTKYSTTAGIYIHKKADALKEPMEKIK